DAAGRTPDHVGRDEVDGAALVVGAPATPVRHAVGDGAQAFHGGGRYRWNAINATLLPYPSRSPWDASPSTPQKEARIHALAHKIRDEADWHPSWIGEGMRQDASSKPPGLVANRSRGSCGPPAKPRSEYSSSQPSSASSDSSGWCAQTCTTST